MRAQNGLTNKVGIKMRARGKVKCNMKVAEAKAH